VSKVSALKIALAAVVAACAGCGGSGSGGSAPPVPTAPAPTSFNLAAARQSWDTSGLTAQFQVSGNTLDGASISGVLDYDESPAGAATVNGQPAVSQTITGTGTLNGAPYSSSEVDYSSPNGETLIWSSTNDFDVAQSPFVWPSTISIGDTGVLGTFSAYTDDTMVLPQGTKQVSYIVKANPADPNSVIFALIANWSYVTGTYEEEDDYVITASGAGSTISRLTIRQASFGATANLVLQAN
jgi:hypothetical protein